MPRRGRPALSPEAREQQMISLAMDRAEDQLRDGTASSQVIVHFLKLATSKAELEKEKLRQENKVLSAKADAYESDKRNGEMYEKAIAAMRKYQGAGDADEY